MSTFERLPIKQWVNLPFTNCPHNTKPILNKKNNETTYELKGRPLILLLTTSNKTNNMIKGYQPKNGNPCMYRSTTIMPTG